MITIDQLLESVDLDFEPRFVTKDENGEITIYSHRPTPEGWCAEWREYEGDYKTFGELKLSEFANKHWTKCIYEVPRKPTRKIEKIILTPATTKNTDLFIVNKINELVDAVNELKGE
jgi:hypothetical protein